MVELAAVQAIVVEASLEVTINPHVENGKISLTFTPSLGGNRQAGP